MIRFMYITNDPNLAKIIYKEGVERIFVDWEVNGKQERQGHLDTVMSKHTLEDVIAVRKAVPKAELMVRLNPFFEGTAQEVEQAILAGADLLMLPMFHTLEEVESLTTLVDGRVGIVPLFETPESLSLVEAISHLKGIEEIYIGLNDLHLALGMHFMFEPLVLGMIDNASLVAKKAGLRFGFGGIARAHEGDVSGAMVMSEHVRLKSDSVILSRTFYRPEDNESAQNVFRRELKLLRGVEEELRIKYIVNSTSCENFTKAVNQVIQNKKAKKTC